MLFVMSLLLSSHLFYSKIIFKLLITKWSRNFSIWIYILRFKDNLAICFDNIIIFINKISSIINSSSLLIMNNSYPILINTFIQIYLISLNIDIKISYKLSEFKLRQVFNSLRRQLLSFFVLLKSFKLVYYIVE